MDGVEPYRRCVACRRSRPKRELVRVAREKGSEPRVDAGQTAAGRGAYVCRDAECVREAVRRGAFARALGAGLGDEQIARLVTEAGEAGGDA